MDREKWSRYKITTERGFVYEVIGDFAKVGEYDFGKLELVEELTIEQKKDLIDSEQKLIEATVKGVV